MAVSLPSLASCLLAAAASIAPDASPQPVPQPSGPAAEEDPIRYAEQAPLDVDTIVIDSSKAYLEARARLVAHPELASSAILDRLASVPAPTKNERKRLLDVLAELGSAEHLPMFAAELRREVKRAGSERAAVEAAQLWLHLLLAQRDAALGELAKLVADTELSTEVRVEVLSAMVAVTPTERLHELVVLVGRGVKPLREQLTRSLHRRAADDADDRVALLVATDAAIEAASDTTQPSLLQLRGTLSTDDDAAWTARLGELARDEHRAFAIRVAAVRGLARQQSSAALQALSAVAEDSLSPGRRGTQRGEVLAWLSLRALPLARARPIVEHHRLRDDGAPRLAALGYALAQLPADHSWLSASQDNPWPEVRQAALARVSTPCDRDTLKLLAERARPKSRTGDKDPAVARSHVQALGRCGPEGIDPLVDLLEDKAADIEQRTEAARQLAKHGGATGADAVAAALARDPSRRFARRLVASARFVTAATPKLTRELCEAATRDDEVGPAAFAVLASLHDDVEAACEE